MPSPILRPVRWPEDESQLRAIDTSFTTDRIYRVRRGEYSFELVLETVHPPIHKSYNAEWVKLDRVRTLEHVRVAEYEHTLVGIVAAHLSSWNRRVQIDDFYVSPEARMQGIGRLLMGSAVSFARDQHVRCVWLETQNTNYPAIQFYRQMGFKWCGFDEELYNPAALKLEEIGLFFALNLDDEP